jgi:hypothetical protein
MYQGHLCTLFFGDANTCTVCAQAHGWIMAVSWGVMIPLGAVIARNFKTDGRVWFNVHRVIQVFTVLDIFADMAFMAGQLVFLVMEYKRRFRLRLFTVVFKLSLALMTCVSDLMPMWALPPLPNFVKQTRNRQTGRQEDKLTDRFNAYDLERSFLYLICLMTCGLACRRLDGS